MKHVKPVLNRGSQSIDQPQKVTLRVRVLLEKLKLAQLVNCLYETRSLATLFTKSNPHIHSFSLKIHFNIVPPPTCISSSDFRIDLLSELLISPCVLNGKHNMHNVSGRVLITNYTRLLLKLYFTVCRRLELCNALYSGAH